LEGEAQALYTETREYLSEESFANVLVLWSLGRFRMELGDEPAAIDLFERAMRITRTHHRDLDDPTQGFVADGLARLYMSVGRYRDAEPLFAEAVRSLRDDWGGEDFRTIDTRHAQGANLLELGKYEEAEEVLVASLRVLRERFPKDPGTAVALNTLCVLYRRTGRYKDATPLYEDLIEMSRETFGAESPEYLLMLNNAALFFDELGQRDRARQLYETALSGVESSIGLDHTYRARIVGNLALIHSDEGDHEKALEMQREACDLWREAVGELHHYHLMALHNLGLEQSSVGHVGEAIETLQRALSLKVEGLGPNHPSCAVTMTALATVYDKAGRFDEAIALHERSAAARRLSLGDHHPALARALANLAYVYWRRGDIGPARSRFIEALDIHRALLRDLFPGLTEPERALYWDNLRDLFAIFTMYALESYSGRAELLGDLYDVQLFAKALILDSVVTARRQAARQQDPEFNRVHEAWLRKKRELASLMTADGIVRGGREPDVLRSELEALEKELARRGRQWTEDSGATAPTWLDVHARLGPGEAAIEIVRARQKGPDTDAGTVYIALIVRADTADHPRLVEIGAASELEGQALDRYRDSLQALATGPYTDYWKPLELELRGVERAYVSPDGVYGLIDANALYDGQRFLIDAIDIRTVSSTRDLLAEKPRYESQRAALFGRPAYDVPVSNGTSREEPPVELREIFEPDPRSLPHFSDLPGTEAEVREIEELLRARGWTVDVFLAEQASTAALLSLKSPRVLHVASHGFYLDQREKRYRGRRGELFAFVLAGQPETEPGESAFLREIESTTPAVPALVEHEAAGRYLADPLFRSGLALAGANCGSGLGDGVADDGLLTAYEANTLDLGDTELVVLSACDSGRGALRAGEGVIGLERALRAAGARNILVALSPIDDSITRELMTAFYVAWLDSSDLRAAFHESQLQLRNRYTLPVLWGGFVLIGR
jgi:CHAT domain-containing protein/tetratricopeptide (TPR) repeat protein